MNAVYSVGASSGYVTGFSLTNGMVLCGPVQSAPSTSAAWVGGAFFGLAFITTFSGTLVLTGNTTSSACSQSQTLALGANTVYSNIAVDAAKTAFVSGYSNAAQNSSTWGIDLSTSTPSVAWTNTTSLAPAGALTGPAIGASGSLLWTRLGADGATGELFVMSLTPPAPGPCAPGEFSPTNATCVPCPVGTYSGPVNASAPLLKCIFCPGGSSTRAAKSSLASDCLPCAAGHFAAGVGGPCLPCAAGSFGASSNATACTLCPAGTASPVLNATSCSQCRAGTYSDAANATTCAPTAPNCYSGAGSSSPCEAALPYAMYGVGPDHAGTAGYAGPEALPSAVKLSVYSGQPTSLPLSGLALGPSGGSVAGKPYDSLVFFGLTDDIFGASSLNGALVNNYDVPTGVSFPGSPAVAPWGVVFIVASDFSLLALDFQVGGSPLWRYSPVVTSRLSYTVKPPTVHGANRAVYYSAASVGIVAVDADTGARLWSFSPGVDPTTSLPYACSTSPALDAAGARIFFGCDDYGVYGLNASTGGQLWVRPCANVVQASPAVSEDGALVFTSSDANNLLALDAVTGLDAWLGVSVANAAVSAAPVIAAGVGVLAVTRDGTLFAANGSAPLSVVWQTQLRDTANGSSVVVGAALTLGSNGTVFVACEGGQLFGVRVADGAVQWMLNLGEPLYAPPILTPTNLLLLPNFLRRPRTPQLTTATPEP